MTLVKGQRARRGSPQFEENHRVHTPAPFRSPGAALIVGTGGLACGANESNTSGDSSSSDKTIALLLPESKTTRYEAFDKPLFEAKVKELCSDCTVDYYNADQDEAKQQQQVETAISQGAKVVVLDLVNGAGAGGMVQSAQDSDAKVIAYDRFIEGVDYYMSFDNETVGKMQADALVKEVGGKGNILMLNGAPSDPNAAQFKGGAQRPRLQRREDPRGVRQPRLEPRERPAVDHRPARQVPA